MNNARMTAIHLPGHLDFLVSFLRHHERAETTFEGEPGFHPSGPIVALQNVRAAMKLVNRCELLCNELPRHPIVDEIEIALIKAWRAMDQGPVPWEWEYSDLDPETAIRAARRCMGEAFEECGTVLRDLSARLIHAVKRGYVRGVASPEKRADALQLERRLLLYAYRWQVTGATLIPSGEEYQFNPVPVSLLVVTTFYESSPASTGRALSALCERGWLSPATCSPLLEGAWEYWGGSVLTACHRYLADAPGQVELSLHLGPDSWTAVEPAAGAEACLVTEDGLLELLKRDDSGSVLDSDGRSPGTADDPTTEDPSAALSFLDATDVHILRATQEAKWPQHLAELTAALEEYNRQAIQSGRHLNLATSRESLGPRVRRLIDKGLLERPHGIHRKGVTITARGRKVLSSR